LILKSPKGRFKRDLLNLGKLFIKAFHRFGGRLLWKKVIDKLKFVGDE